MKKKILLTPVLAAIIACSAFSAFANGFSVNDTFENGVCNWADISSDRGKTAVLQETGGNKYVQITYDAEGTAPQKYYDMRPMSAQTTTGVIQADFDINYSETDVQRSTQVQFKSRTGQGVSQTQIAARLIKNYYYLQYDNGGVLMDLPAVSGGSFIVSKDTWYTVRMIVNLEEKWQSIYVSDRNSKTLLAKVEKTGLGSEIDSINMITFSGTTTINLDNVQLAPVVLNKMYITGNPYPKKIGISKTYNYTLTGLSTTGRPTYTDDVIWELETPLVGVSINSNTGVLTVQNTAPITQAVIKATSTKNSNLAAKYLIDIEY